MFPFTNVDIVADAATLPFKDNSVDMLISESTIEHTPNPEQVIREICRVVKPGGLLHQHSFSSRSTHPRTIIPPYPRRVEITILRFYAEENRNARGPASALVTLLMYIFALPSRSFRSRVQPRDVLFMVLLSPLRFLDLLFIFPRSIEVSAMLYYVGEKKDTDVTSH